VFGLSWGQIIIIVLVGVFVLGPERIPTAVTWVMTSLRKMRTMAAGAQAELRKEIGPEIEELRRQVADLQSLKELQELRELRDLHPKRLIGKSILGDEFSGGIGGFLGLSGPAKSPGATGAPIGQNAPAVPANMGGPGAPDSLDVPGVVAAGLGAGSSSNPPATATGGGVPLGVQGSAGSMNGADAPARGPLRPLEVGERPPFDPDGT